MERGSTSPTRDDVEDKKMKGKVVEEEPTMEPQSADPLLDLRLYSGDEVGEGSKKEVNFLDLFGSDDSPDGESTKKKPAVTKQYNCKFCDRKFCSSQALGGHQNAHKRERAVMKTEQAIEANPFGIMYPFQAVAAAASMAGFRGHLGPYINNSNRNNNLGVNMQSMIQKPPYHHHLSFFHAGSGSNNGREGWRRQANMNSQPNYVSARSSYPTLDTLLHRRPQSLGASNQGGPSVPCVINYTPNRNTGATDPVDLSGAGVSRRIQQCDHPTGAPNLSLNL